MLLVLLLTGGSGLLDGDPAIVGRLALIEESSRRDREGVEILFGVSCARAERELEEAEDVSESTRLRVEAVSAAICIGGKFEGRASGGESTSAPLKVCSKTC